MPSGVAPIKSEFLIQKEPISIPISLETPTDQNENLKKRKRGQNKQRNRKDFGDVIQLCNFVKHKKECNFSGKF